ncbi:MAG: 50S ribosomal protein L11 methyltransferase [Blastocatellia bacterium]
MTSDGETPDSEIKNSRWWLVALSVPPGAAEAASSILFEAGSSGIITLDETAEGVNLGAYFDDPRNASEITQALQAELERAGLGGELRSFSISHVPEQDWMQKWKEGFEPVWIGSRLIIAPSWKLPEEDRGRVVIQIDPGMAFGTGTHETTRLCLEAIEHRWRGGSLLDVGTGTGILAIAAALLAPGSRVIAIDVDPLAIDVARENLAINGVSRAVELAEGQPRNFTGGRFNIVVANLTAEVIVDLMADLAGCVDAGGSMILSGILCELAEDVEKALAASGFKVTERRDAGEWCILIAERT